MADWMNVPLLYYEGLGRAPQRVGLAHPSICPFGAFETKDGVLVLISIQNEREWAAFCARFMLQPELPGVAGFDSNNARVANRPAVDAAVAAVFRTMTRDEAAERLRFANAAFGLVNDVASFARHPSLRRTEIQTQAGPVQVAAPPVIWDGVPPALGPVPGIGADTAAITAEFAGTT